MKKIVIILSCIIILSFLVINYNCKETLIEIKKIGNNETETVLQVNAFVPKEKIKTTSKKRYVNIVIMCNGYSSIFHSNIKIKSKNMNVYYGKNFRNKIDCKELNIGKNSKYFKNNKSLKIYGKSRMCLVGHNVENNCPTYAGAFYVYKTSKGFVLVNNVELEEYVARVISSEIGEGAPLEALKAQAVCARTYILKAKNNEYKKYNAIADDSTNFQVYNRIDAGKKCYQAAKDTTGVVMKYNRELINSYYFSTSCGYTTDYYIWGKDKKKYLKGENITKEKEKILTNNKAFEKYIKRNPKAYESNYPFFRWKLNLTPQQISNAVYTLTGENVGKIKNIEVSSRGKGGIASQITIYGNEKQIIIKNQNDIRKALCSVYGKIKLNDGQERTGMDMLPSAFIHIEKKGNVFIIYGGGFGHGSGMSQNAAIEMAKEKKSYDNILKKFYNNVELVIY